jgi:Ca2+-binding EF-hand superfamily protein
MFSTLDEEKDGELEPEEMISAFKTIFGLECTPRKWQSMMKMIDFHADGNIQFTEFLVASSKK